MNEENDMYEEAEENDELEEGIEGEERADVDWSEWQLLATTDGAHQIESDEDFMGVYELGVAEGSEEDVDPVYVKCSANVLEEIEAHAAGETNLAEEIKNALDSKLQIYGRWFEAKSETIAEELEEQLLNQHDYEWNVLEE